MARREGETQEKQERLRLIREKLQGLMIPDGNKDGGFSSSNPKNLFELIDALVEHPRQGTTDEVFGETKRIFDEVVAREDFKKLAKESWISGLTPEQLDSIAETVDKSGAEISQ